jgi:hypothetical protein
MNLPFRINLTTFIIKRAAGEPAQAPINPRILAAILGGGAGALGGGAIQGVRKLMQSKRDEEENGSPSILKGMLLGGLGGAGVGAGLEHWRGQGGSDESSIPAFADHSSQLAGAAGLTPTKPITGSVREMEEGAGYPTRPTNWGAQSKADPLQTNLLRTPARFGGVPNENEQAMLSSAMFKKILMGAPSPSSLLSGTIPAPSLPPYAGGA